MVIISLVGWHIVAYVDRVKVMCNFDSEKGMHLGHELFKKSIVYSSSDRSQPLEK